MSRKRMNERIHVDLPVTCSLEGQDGDERLHGRILDLSISGIKLDLPMHDHEIRTSVVDFELDLPKPFSRIRGSGEIQWKQWNQDSGSTTCGLKLEPMCLKHLVEIDTIIQEIQGDQAKRGR